MGTRYHLSFGAFKTAWLAPELLVSIGPSHHLWVLHANSDFLTRITSPYGSQTSPVILCMQNSVISTRIANLYWCQPHLRFCAFNTATLAPGWQVYMVSSPHLWFCAYKTATLGPHLQVCMGPRPHLCFWAHITACLAQEHQVYMGSSPRLWFCGCKTASLAPE